MRRGAFTIPASVADASRKFKMEADPLRGFIEERVRSTHPNSPTKVARTDVYMAYVTWAGLNGFQQMSAARFYEQFSMAAVDALPHPMTAVIIKGERVFKGIALR